MIDMKVVPKGFRLVVTKCIAAVADTQLQYAKETTKLVEKATSTWAHKPQFTYRRSGFMNISVEILTNHPTFRYIDEGTHHRWAVMSSDWASKSRPNSLIADAGRGHVMIRGKRAMHARGYRAPKPGVKARNFFEQASITVIPRYSQWLYSHLIKRNITV